MQQINCIRDLLYALPVKIICSPQNLVRLSLLTFTIARQHADTKGM